MIGAYLSNGRDVVLSQMLIDASELAKFETSAIAVGAQFVECVLMDTPTATVERFHRRGPSEEGNLWNDQVRVIVEEGGGDELLVRCHAALEHLALRPDAIVIASTEGRIVDTYQTFLKAVG